MFKQTSPGLEIQDHEMFTITKKLYSGIKKYQDLNRLREQDIPEFKQTAIRPLHPHKMRMGEDGVTPVASKYTCKQICCQLQLGRFWRWKAEPSDDHHTDLGVAMCLYFKFLKHIGLLFLLISIFSIFSVLLFFKVADSNKINITRNYSEFLFSASLGVLSLQEIKCTYHIQQTAPITFANFTLSCPTGFIQETGATYTQNSFQSIQNCNEEVKMIQSNNSGLTFTKVSDCTKDSTTCGVNLTVISANPDSRFMSYVYSCVEARYEVGALSLTKKQIMAIIVAIDLLICIMIFLFILSENSAEKQEIQDFRTFQVTLKDYSIEVESFSQDKIFTQSSEFVEMINKQNRKRQMQVQVQVQEQQNIQVPLNQNYKELQDDIVEVKLPQGQLQKQYYSKSKNSEKIFSLIRNEFFQKNISPQSYANQEEFRTKHFATPKRYISFKKSITKYLNKFIKIKEKYSKNNLKNSEQSPENSTNQKKHKKQAIILTFENPSNVQNLLQWRKKKCCSQKLYLQSAGQNQNQQNLTKQFTLKQPPVPDLILWENKGKNHVLRKLISWILTLAIVFGSIVLIGFILSRQKKILEKYNFNVDCEAAYPSETFDTFESTRLSQQFYQHCFCSSHSVLSALIDTEFKDECQQWSNQYSLYLSIPILFSFGIVCYNVTISYLFLFLSYFQAHELLNHQLTSYIIKRSIVLTLNSGVILTALNFKYNFKQDFLKLYQGTFTDFTGDWYFLIGVIITLTVIFNMMFPMLQLALYSVVHAIRVCWDKKCFTRQTSLMYKHEYLNIYGGFVYPIQERYSTIISVLFISLLFNGAVPFINIVLVFFFFTLFVTDRCLIFKLFRRPPNYENTLHRHMVKAIYGFLVLHMIMTAFLLTSPYIRSQALNIELFQINSGRLAKIFTTGYSIPYVIIFIILVVLGIFWFFQRQFFTKIYRKCCKKANKQAYNQQRPQEPEQSSMFFMSSIPKINTKFYDTLNKPQVSQLINVSEYQIQRETKLLERVNLASSHKQIPPQYPASGQQDNVLALPQSNINEESQQSKIQLNNAKKYETFLRIQEKRNVILKEKMATKNLHSRMPRRAPVSVDHQEGQQQVQAVKKQPNNGKINQFQKKQQQQTTMIGPASYEKQHHEKMLQEQIQIIFLDNLTTKLKKNRDKKNKLQFQTTMQRQQQQQHQKQQQQQQQHQQSSQQQQQQNIHKIDNDSKGVQKRNDENDEKMQLSEMHSQQQMVRKSKSYGSQI